MLQMNSSNLMVSHNKLRVEDATSARKRTTSNTANEFRKGSVEIFVRKKSSPAESKKKQKKKNKNKNKTNSYFGDCICCHRRLLEFNYWLHKSFAQMKSSSGGIP